MKLVKDLSILQKGGEVRYAPFPHLVIENCLPETLYEELVESRPPPEFFVNGRELGNNLRMDRHAAETLRDPQIPPLWRTFIEYHTSDDFWLEVISIFGDAIKLLYPQLEFEKKLDQYNTAIRFKGASDINMECQPGINTPVTEPSRVRGPHLDNPVELVAGLLYMRPPDDNAPGGDLDICRVKRPYRCYGKAEIDDRCVEVVSTVPYKANTLVMFVNSPLSVHSVTPRPVNNHYRQLVNFAMELNQPLFKLPK